MVAVLAYLVALLTMEVNDKEQCNEAAPLGTTTTTTGEAMD